MAMPGGSILFLFLFLHSGAATAFDVRQHLSTVTRYDVARNIAAASGPSKVPDECKPIHLNLVARHGTRSPTKKRIRELDRLADDLELLVQKAKTEAEKYDLSLQNVPEWLHEWRSPWKGKQKGGELVVEGEDELYDMASRVRKGFPELFQEDYDSDVFVMKSTQVPRASASAVAFGIGLFCGRGTLGPGRQRSFSVTTESRARDLLLRFFDSCESYKVYRKHQDPAVDKLKEPILDEITSALRGRFHLNFTRQETSSLWFLCKQQASLLGITDQACGLFNPSEVALLEWTDDLELFILKGYGKALNYRMGVPLLEDVLQSMEDAIKAKEEGLAPGSYEKARLRFAHAETLVPFSCLLGLFLDGSEFEQIQMELPLQLPPKPPSERKWWGSIVSPFAGNTMLVLYHCSSNASRDYYVQVLHNEYPVTLPGCHNYDICPFEVFKDKIVAPHQKHDHHRVCGVDMNSAGPETMTSYLNRAGSRLAGDLSSVNCGEVGLVSLKKGFTFSYNYQE